MPRYGGLGVFGSFVFQGDIAAIVGSPEDTDQPFQVGLFLLLARPLDLRFDLHGDGVRGEPSEIGVWIVANEIARVPIDAEPVVL